jgi:cation diffusion facilitator CzcD-associated flavoprotein CzcO
MATVDAVAVIGAGASGLAAARYLQSEAAFSTIAVFEQRGAVGGLWNATPHVDAAAPGDGEPPFASPVYDGLHTNLPHSLMRFSDLPFPDAAPLLPPHDVVREYLERYADAADVRRLLRLGVQVLSVRPAAVGWAVAVRDLRTRDESTVVFDAVVVASGHFDRPFVPDVPGLGAWQAAYPEAVSHSMSYRRPGAYRDKASAAAGPRPRPRPASC